MRTGRKIPYSVLVLSLVGAFFQPILAPTASAAITTAACKDTFGTPANVTVSVTSDDCVLKFTGNSTWTAPTGVTSIRFLLVGGGAADQPAARDGRGGVRADPLAQGAREVACCVIY